MSVWTHCRVEPTPYVTLAPLTTWGLGGEARWYAEPHDIIDLAMLLRAAKAQRLRVLLLGGGSNVLITDHVLQALVIRLAGEFQTVSVESANARLRCGAACLLSKAMAEAEEEGLTGLEFFAGIPGTIGGAICVNAGAQGHSIGTRVRAVEVMDLNGHTTRLDRNDLSFVYRRSNLEDRIVMAAELQLEHDFPDPVAARRKAFLHERKRGQPWGARSAGCVFRNPPGEAAGRLIEEAGCKGWREGHIVVSDIHANFFINEGGGTCAECLCLIERVRKAVFEARGIRLDLEVRIWQ